MFEVEVPVVTALIAGVVSIIVSSIGIYIAFRKMKIDEIAINRKLNVEISSTLLTHRLENYGQAFDITEKIYPRSSNRWFQQSEVRQVLSELRKWKSGIVSVIISSETLRDFRKLEDALSRKPGDSDSYRHDQIENIYGALSSFRSHLRYDLRQLHRSDELERVGDHSRQKRTHRTS